jgi:hypothetical protein
MRNQSVRSYTQRIEASPEVVSPLICPVREGQWLDGWADGFELIYSASEFAEKNCLFRTYGHGEPEMTWTVSEHDQARGVVEFVRVMTGLAACTLRVTIGDGGDGTSVVGIVYVITPVSDEGERVAAASRPGPERDWARRAPGVVFTLPPRGPRFPFRLPGFASA